MLLNISNLYLYVQTDHTSSRANDGGCKSRMTSSKLNQLITLFACLHLWGCWKKTAIHPSDGFLIKLILRSRFVRHNTVCWSRFNGCNNDGCHQTLVPRLKFMRHKAGEGARGPTWWGSTQSGTEDVTQSHATRFLIPLNFVLKSSQAGGESWHYLRDYSGGFPVRLGH